MQHIPRQNPRQPRSLVYPWAVPEIHPMSPEPWRISRVNMTVSSQERLSISMAECSVVDEQHKPIQVSCLLCLQTCPLHLADTCSENPRFVLVALKSHLYSLAISSLLNPGISTSCYSHPYRPTREYRRDLPRNNKPCNTQKLWLNGICRGLGVIAI